MDSANRRLTALRSHLNLPGFALAAGPSAAASAAADREDNALSGNSVAAGVSPTSTNAVAPARDRNAAEPVFIGPTSHYYVSQRLKLHYVDWGNQNKPLLVLVHGGRDHCRSFDWMAKDLRDLFHVVALDLRGHGDSQWATGGEYQIPEFALDLHQLLNVINKFPVNIVAHSLGSFVSQLYTAMFPENVKRLVLLDGLGMPPAQQKVFMSEPYWARVRQWIQTMQVAAARQPRRYKTIAEAAQRMKEENSFLSAEQSYHLTVFGVSRNEDGTYAWKFDPHLRHFFPQQYAPNSFAEQASRISCPVLALWGTKSWQGDPSLDGRLEPFKSIKSVPIAGAGHWVHHDKLDEVLQHTRAFLLSH